jgi:hypothetical protein
MFMTTFMWFVIAITVATILLGPAMLLQIGFVLLMAPLLLVVFRWILK